MRRLLIRPGAIGDFIVSLPALEALRADYTEVWCAESNVPLARFADQAFSLGAMGVSRLGLLPSEDVVERLRQFDSIVSWSRVGGEIMEELALPVRFLNALPAPGIHATDFYNRQARALGGCPARAPAIPCPRIDRQYAVIHPFASSPKKRVPIEIFRRSARRLGQKMKVHWLAGPEEHLDEAVRIGNLYDLACWLAGARVYVGNDSGISHLAAAVGTPVLALFRATHPREWSPRGQSAESFRIRC